MMKTMSISVLGIIVGIVLVAILPPFLDGIARKVKARIQYRVGPPILQTYYDLQKLFGLPSLRPTENKWFRVAPYLALASAFSAAFLLPYGKWVPVKFSGDIVVFFYVLAMVSVAIIIGAFSTQNAHSNIGGHREMMMVLSVEPILGVALGIFAFKAGTLSLSAIPLKVPASFSTVLAYLLLIYAAYAESGFVPCDIAEAETEIAGGVLVEYSGRRLGVLEYAILAKRLVLLWLLSTFLTIPILRGITLTGVVGGIVVLAVQLILVLVAYPLIAALEATNARYRIDQAVALNTRIFLLSLVVLAVAAVGW